jgi:hypothetical protein
VTPDARARLDAHVAGLVAAARPPAPEVNGLIEEMLGPLVETVEERVAAGVDEDEAVRSAIAAFGGPEVVGRDLARTYHSRLWASSIGILLAAGDARGERPGSIRALRILLAIDVLFEAVGTLIALVTMTPLVAVVDAVVGLAFLLPAVLAYRGLNVGLRWSLWFAVGAVAGLVLEGALPVTPPPPGTTVIPVLAIAAGATLFWLWFSAEEVDRFIAPSRSIGRLLAVALAVAVILPPATARAFRAIADPTQAEANDVSLGLSMDCVRRDDGHGGPVRQYATIRADIAFRRTDLLPFGLSGQLDRSDVADAAGFRLLGTAPIEVDGGPPIPAWLLDGDGVDVRRTDTGDVAGWFGASSTAVTMLPDTIGSFTAGIDPDRIEADRTIRITWTVTPVDDGEHNWPRADVAFAHLTRFLIEGTVECGGHAVGAPVLDARPQPEGSNLLSG